MTDLQTLQSKINTLQARLDSLISGADFTLVNEGAPPLPAAGFTVIYATTTGAASVYMPSGMRARMSLGLSNTSSFTAHTTSETNLTTTWSIPANDAQVGTVYRIKTWGKGTYASGSNTWIQTAAFNSASKGQAGFPSLPSSYNVWVEGNVQVLTTGSSGTANFSTSFVVGANATPSAGVGMDNAVSIDTTTATTFQMSCAGNGTFSITCYGSTFERIGQ